MTWNPSIRILKVWSVKKRRFEHEIITTWLRRLKIYRQYANLKHRHQRPCCWPRILADRGKDSRIEVFRWIPDSHIQAGQLFRCRGHLNISRRAVLIRSTRSRRRPRKPAEWITSRPVSKAQQQTAPTVWKWRPSRHQSAITGCWRSAMTAVIAVWNQQSSRRLGWLRRQSKDGLWASAKTIWMIRSRKKRTASAGAKCYTTKNVNATSRSFSPVALATEWKFVPLRHLPHIHRRHL